MLHRSLLHRLAFSVKLSPVIFSLKGGDDQIFQIFRHLWTELDRSNKALLPFLFETSDPGVDELVLVPVVGDIHPEMIGSRMDRLWLDGETERTGDGETERKGHSSER